MTNVRFRLEDVLLLLLTVALAAGARVGYLIRYADHAANAGPLLVQDVQPEQEALIGNVKDHRWFGALAPFAAVEERTAHTAPGYPWLLGELNRLPLEPGAMAPLVRWIQCGLGALTAAFYFLFAWRAFRSRLVAVLAGLFCALHPFWIVATAALADSVLASFLLAASVFLGCRGGQVGGALTSLLYGLSLAALALVRAALLPFAVVALLWFLFRCRRLPTGWQASLLAFLGFITGLAPWGLRNYEHFQDAFPIVDTTYLHLWMGNNVQATGGPLSESAMLHALAERRDEDTVSTAQLLAGMDQPQRYRFLAESVVDEVQRDSLATMQRRLWAGLYFVFGEDWFTQRKLWRDAPAAGETEGALVPGWPYPVLLTGSLLVLLVLSLLGWRWTYAWRQEAMPASLAVFWIPLPYLLSHAEALSGPRLPLDGVLLCYSAFALCCLVPGVGRSLREGEPIRPPSGLG
ncbi:MAG: hypothetical protein K2R98_31335 [Gemmataceae bacterium]|nr:hypothetical protein [Gemmataceae bacterium]